MELNSMVEKIVDTAQDKKAFDIVVFNIEEKSSIADRLIVMSGNSERQVVGISEEIEDILSRDEGINPKNKEGRQTARWILLDYGDVVVHVFHKEEREFYNLEKLWIDAESTNIEDIQ